MIFDMRALTGPPPRASGTGGLAYAFDGVSTRLTIKVVSTSGVAFRGPPLPEIVHMYRVFAEFVELPGLLVSGDQDANPHMGFGSTSARLTGFAAALSPSIETTIVPWKASSINRDGLIMLSRISAGFRCEPIWLRSGPTCVPCPSIL